MKEMLTISEVAHQLSLNPQTIYFYERIGLIPAPRRSGGGYRLFSKEDVTRLSLIIGLKSLDLTLEEIRWILKLKDNHGLTCQQVAQELQDKIIQLDAKIAQMQTLRTELTNLFNECQSRIQSHLQPCEGSGSRCCNIPD
ncbi:heavy metal-responsive transcriptional regulator [Crocosphaera sp. UHCC 0190]|uniref:heavy metal-responsive transcriptional regulator n=1 Tax=Crocosphaera sp. UHCC 0190 TaxID=3110246 RepID=UPI002B21250C|nr:heavy metal-responsive transcriptional regulator [Crocosphaera sp. UHCC 0190]MEA5509298.1 heavy metal-responsive transcriptional regulator [Crocosphaera sp. UHCC 0190]